MDVKKHGTPIQETIAKYINENMDVINENVCMIFYETEVDKNVVFEAVNKNGIICEFNELNQMQLVRKLSQICKSYGVNADDSTLNYLIEVSRN